MYFRPEASWNPHFNLEEIEAFATGLVRSFQKSREKYNISFSIEVLFTISLKLETKGFSFI